MHAINETEPASSLKRANAASKEVAPGIFKTSGVCGGSACIRQKRMPVWGLVSYRRLGLSDAGLLEAFPTLTLEDLSNAWCYAAQNAAEIEKDIEENELS